jgi:hypothetical protein
VPTRYAFVFLLSTKLWAQFTGHAAVRGELQMDSADIARDYQVELADCSGGTPGLRALMFGNRFEFDNVVPGCKMLRVLAGPQRNVIQEVQVCADGSGVPLELKISRPEKDPVRGQTVSVERLRHPVPENVMRAVADASRLWQAGRFGEAANKLRPLVAKYPDIWELRLNAGVVEMKLDNLSAAAEHLSKAHELAPRSMAAALESAVVLLRLERWEEAESAAKDAVALDPGNAVARKLLTHIEARKPETQH